MKTVQGHVLLAEIHPLVQEAIRLLLQDCHYNIAIVHDAKQWQVQVHAIPGPPELIITPLELENGASGERLVDRLRAYFRSDIPAILLNGDHGTDALKILAGNTVVLSNTLEPTRLRKVIGELLNDQLVE